MQKQLIRQIAVVLLVVASLYGTGQLGTGYLQGVFGTPEAQWQFAFMLTPIPIALGVIALLIATCPRPSLQKFFAVASWVATSAPALLFAIALGSSKLGLVP